MTHTSNARPRWKKAPRNPREHDAAVERANLRRQRQAAAEERRRLRKVAQALRRWEDTLTDLLAAGD